MIKRLLKIANELDRKGFRKEADTLDKIAQDWVDRDDSFAASMEAQRAETSDLDMASLRSGAVEKHDAAMAAEPGKIRPAGDRFTYNYIPEGDYFVVATAPEKQSFAVGAKLKKGTPAYNTLSASPVAQEAFRARAALKSSVHGLPRLISSFGWGENAEGNAAGARNIVDKMKTIYSILDEDFNIDKDKLVTIIDSLNVYEEHKSKLLAHFNPGSTYSNWTPLS